MYISLFNYCIPLGFFLYIFPFMYMYIFGSRVLISIQLLFITWYTKLVFRVRDVLSLSRAIWCALVAHLHRYVVRDLVAHLHRFLLPLQTWCALIAHLHRYIVRDLRSSPWAAIEVSPATGSLFGHCLRASSSSRRRS
jgi:hypothetical protein